MKRGLLYLQLKPAADWVFEPPLLQLIKRNFPKLPTFELDQQSDELSRQYALQFAEQAERLLIVAEAQGPQETLQSFGSLINLLIRQKHTNVHVLQLGEHPMLKRILQALGGAHYQSCARPADVIKSLQQLFTHPE